MKIDLDFGAFVLCLLVPVCLFVLLMCVVGYVSISADRRCLQAGYAESKVAIDLHAYCVQRYYQGVMKAIPLREATK